MQCYFQETAGGGGTCRQGGHYAGNRGLHSSNTQKLYKLCKEICKNIYHIETADDLPLENIKGAESIGITAGASTPDWIIKEVIDKMTEMDKMKQQETNEQTSEEQMF